MSRTLDHAFRPYKGFGLGLRLCLTNDALELRRFGALVRRVPLSAVENVTLAPNTQSARNIRVHVRNEEDIQGHVAAVSLWKFALRDRLGLELIEAPSLSDARTPRRRAA